MSWHGRGIHPEEKMTPFQQEPPITPHGVPDHNGWRCYQCSQLSGSFVQLADSGGDYWQNLQLLWQEKCDVLQNAFDDDVATHFPKHKPIGCKSCPKVFEMPIKPLPPAERAVSQG